MIGQRFFPLTFVWKLFLYRMYGLSKGSFLNSYSGTTQNWMFRNLAMSHMHRVTFISIWLEGVEGEYVE